MKYTVDLFLLATWAKLLEKSAQISIQLKVGET